MSTEIKENILGVSGDIDIENPEVKTHANSLIAQAMESSFLTPYMAIERISNVLSKFHIPIPKSSFLEGDHGYKIFDVQQFGHKFGMNDQGEVVQKDGCECSIYFEYQRNEEGSFDIFCEIVSPEELDDLLADIEDEESENDINEAAIPHLKAKRALTKVLHQDRIKRAIRILNKNLKDEFPQPKKKAAPKISEPVRAAAKTKKSSPKKKKKTTVQVIKPKAKKPVAKKPPAKKKASNKPMRPKGSPKKAPKEQIAKIVKKAKVKKRPLPPPPPPVEIKKKKKVTVKKRKQSVKKKPELAKKVVAAVVHKAKRKPTSTAPAMKKEPSKVLHLPNIDHALKAVAAASAQIATKKEAEIVPEPHKGEPIQPVQKQRIYKDDFEREWDKSSLTPGHYSPTNLKRLHDLAHSEQQRAASIATKKSDYDTLNNDYHKRRSMIASAVHHFTSTTDHNNIMKHIENGTIEPDHIVLDHLHRTAKRDLALGKTPLSTYKKRISKINDLSLIVHGQTEKERIPGANPDSRLGRLLTKIGGSRKVPMKTFSEQQIQKALEIMDQKVL